MKFFEASPILFPAVSDTWVVVIQNIHNSVYELLYVDFN